VNGPADVLLLGWAEPQPGAAPGPSVNLRNRIPAGLFAGTTGLRTHSAMFVRLRMRCALLAANATSVGAGLDGGPENVNIGAGAAGGHCARSSTDIGAVEVEANAQSEFLDHFFAETCVGTAGACLGARIALFNTFQQGFGGTALDLWMCADHLADVHLRSPRLKTSHMTQGPENFTLEMVAAPHRIRLNDAG
jgi:hypothetical protein